MNYNNNIDSQLQAGLEKLGIHGIHDTKQFAFSQTNEAGSEAQRLDRTQSNAYLVQTARQSLTKATAISQYYLGFNCLYDNNQLDKCILCLIINNLFDKVV